MNRLGPYLFKQAESDDEFAQVHKLNYDTFVQEIPQHHDTGTGFLIDKFHQKNTYLICLRDNRLVGMVCYHDQRPFSAADRIPDLSVIDKPGMKIWEVRLMAVIPEERNGAAFAGLVDMLFERARTAGATHFLISSHTNQRPLHLSLGFEPIGPDVGEPEAQFAPMLASVDQVGAKVGTLMAYWKGRRQSG
jgi:hypothetical protein